MFKAGDKVRILPLEELKKLQAADPVRFYGVGWNDGMYLYAGKVGHIRRVWKEGHVLAELEYVWPAEALVKLHAVKNLTTPWSNV